jgi:phosphoribosylanthranilate isomerase
MTWVKICGITNLEDALVAVEAGADAVGFVFYEKSPRKIVADSAREILAKIPLHIERVGVFVNTSLKEVFETAEAAGLSAIQVYGDQSEVSRDYLALAKSAPRQKLIYAMDGNGFADSGGVHQKSYMWLISQRLAEGLYALLVDCASVEKPGGSGNKFDWTRARGAVQVMNAIKPTIVAGGLDAQNVATAMTLLQPWGVDVSSGVEARPGKKDPEKVRAFIKAVREADKANSRN